MIRTVTAMRYIAQMREGDRITDIYLCKQKQTLRSKSGKNYFSMVLQDRTGIMDAKIWDLSNGINHFEAMDYIHVEGEVTSYQGSLQLNVRRVRLAQESEYETGDYLPRSRYNPDAMYQELLKYVDSIQNEKMKKLVKSFLVDDK
ncbi:MAG: hydrolase, partial [Lachnospiraceae bacterium]|nr:hydrolase [Lachnospiraceae bacterium]